MTRIYFLPAFLTIFFVNSVEPTCFDLANSAGLIKQCNNDSLNDNNGILDDIGFGLAKLFRANKIKMAYLVESQLEFALAQYQLLDKMLPEGVQPRSVMANGSLWTSGSKLWTCGFYAGTLWFAVMGREIE